MCGRYTLRTNPRDLADLFGLAAVPAVSPRFNVGPGTPAPAVRTAGGQRELFTPVWGLLPRFVADPKQGPRPINARAETVATNGFFKHAFARRRCLIPADGFYEPEEDARGKTGRWWFFRFEDDRPFAFGGLWETWGEGAEFVETFTLVTTGPMAAVVKCGHQRSPLIVPPERFDLWLDPEAKPGQVKRLLVPLPSDGFSGYPTNGRAKNPRNEGPDLVEPAG